MSTILVVAMTAPLTSSFGLWDRWPSWGLYAPRGERARVFVHELAVDRLPAGVPVDRAGGSGRWRAVRLDDWLLEQTGAPLYPQNRVVVALALALDERAPLGGYLLVEVDSAAGRISGVRQVFRLEGADEIRRYAAGRYWLNTSPRWTR